MNLFSLIRTLFDSILIPTERNIELWEVSSQSHLYSFPCDEEVVDLYACKFNNQECFCQISKNGKVVITSFDTCSQVLTFETHVPARPTRFFIVNEHLIVGYEDGQLFMWRIQAEELIRVSIQKVDHSSILAMDLNDELLLLGCASGMFKVFTVPQKPIFQAPAPALPVELEVASGSEIESQVEHPRAQVPIPSTPTHVQKFAAESLDEQTESNECPRDVVPQPIPVPQVKDASPSLLELFRRGKILKSLKKVEYALNLDSQKNPSNHPFSVPVLHSSLLWKKKLEIVQSKIAENEAKNKESELVKSAPVLTYALHEQKYDYSKIPKIEPALKKVLKIPSSVDPDWKESLKMKPDIKSIFTPELFVQQRERSLRPEMSYASNDQLTAELISRENDHDEVLENMLYS